MKRNIMIIGYWNNEFQLVNQYSIKFYLILKKMISDFL